MNLSGTQLKDTYGNLVTTGTSAGSPTEGGLQNGDGQLLTSVGIGTNLPASGGANTQNVHIHNPTANSTFLKLSTSGTGSSSSDGLDLAIDNSGNGYFINRENANIHFYTNGDEKLRIEADGDIAFYDDANNQGLFWDASTARLGLGTTSPDYKLQINGSGTVARFTDGTSHMDFYSGSGLNEIATASPLLLSVGGTERMRIDASGNVGIGTDSPSSKLTVAVNVIDGATTDSIRLIDADDDTTVGTENRIRFGKWVNSDGSGVSDVASIHAGISQWGATSGLRHGYLSFYTVENGSNTEKVRITDSGNVGIGTTSPDTKLHNVGTTLLGNGAWPTSTVGNSASRVGMLSTSDQILVIANTNGTVGANNGAEIYLGATATTSTADMAVAKISGKKVNATSGNKETYLAFSTSTSGGTITERMRIDSSGNVGIGTDSPEKKLHIYDTTIANQAIRLGNPSAAPYGEIHYDPSGSEFLNITSKGTLAGYGNIRFYTGGTPTEAMRIDSSGNVSITTGNLILDSGAGIDFSDTPNSSGTMTSELLDDYEEGTWTPAWNFATSGSATLSIDSATYTKIGRVVNVNARIFTSSISSPLGKATLTGLPFTANSAIYDVPGSVAELFRWATDIQNLKVIVINNQSYLEMTFNSATDSLATDLSGSDFDSGASKNIMSISVTYFV